MSRYKTDPLVMERVRQILYDTGLTNKELGDALGPVSYTHLIADRVKDAQFQVAAQRTAVVEGIPFLLYGRLDALKAGVIYDIKFSRSYQVGKYLDSPQHPMYCALVPEARRFEYLVFTGSDVCVEKYGREDSPDVLGTIRDFMRYLEASKLDKLYCQKWETR